MLLKTYADFASGGHAPSFLYRIVADHYRTDDVVL